MRPEPIRREPTCEVPFPFKMPVRVVLPVPPFATATTPVTFAAVPETEPVIVEEKVLVPEKVLLFARSVEEAAVRVISALPLKDVPLMVRAVARVVAVAALPPMLRVEVLVVVSAVPALFV